MGIDNGLKATPYGHLEYSETRGHRAKTRFHKEDKPLTRRRPRGLDYLHISSNELL